MEIWKDVTGYEGLYQISSLGRVKSLSRPVINNKRNITVRVLPETILSPCLDKNGRMDSAGYLTVGLYKNGKLKSVKVHRLVGLHFVDGYFKGAVINHKNENTLNNLPENLEWLTSGENVRYSFCDKKHSKDYKGYIKDYKKHLNAKEYLSQQRTNKSKIMANKKILPNGCSYSISVTPKNWKTSKANVNQTWFISYRFYENGQNPFHVIIKGMNQFKELKARQVVTESLLNNEIKALETGFNPRKKEIDKIDNLDQLTNHTLESALFFALEKKKMELRTKQVTKGYLNKCLTQAKKLKYNSMPVTDIERRHVIDIIDDFSDNIYNEARARLKLLFKELVKRQIIKFNPVDELIEVRQVARKPKKLLTPEERKKLYSLKETHYTFWRYINIFYHSSRRTPEILAVKKEDVDLRNQRFQVIQKKGNKTRWVSVTIEDNALAFWQELMDEAKEDHWYLLSEGLRPGERSTPIRTDQIRRRWRVYVQQRLGIKQGIYILKYLHLDEIAAEQNIEAAQMSAGHSSAIVTKMYAVGEDEREHERKRAKGGRL
jgi:integrase